MLPSVPPLFCQARASMSDEIKPVILPRHGRWTSLSCYTLATQQSLRLDPLSFRPYWLHAHGMFLLPQSNSNQHEHCLLLSSEKFLINTWGENGLHLQPALQWRHLAPSRESFIWIWSFSTSPGVHEIRPFWAAAWHHYISPSSSFNHSSLCSACCSHVRIGYRLERTAEVADRNMGFIQKTWGLNAWKCESSFAPNTWKLYLKWKKSTSAPLVSHHRFLYFKVASTSWGSGGFNLSSVC